jgi:regulator of cell morphogenesis and NO signaling
MPNLKSNISSTFEKMEINELLDYIINIHHAYLAKNLPILWENTQKIAKKHADKYPELLEIAQLIEDFVTDLPGHLAQEERILFPYMRKLDEAQKNKAFDDIPPFQFLQKPISHAESDHDDDILALQRLKELSQNFTAPPDACEVHNFTFQQLAEFENDLLKHIALENEILFPKAKALEKEMWLV